MMSPAAVWLVLLAMVAALSLCLQQRKVSFHYIDDRARRTIVSDVAARQQRHRPTVGRDEFVHKGASVEEISAYFSVTANFDEVEKIDPMWVCSDYTTNPRERQKKLVFLHIWRSAGATVRALLRAYAHYCQASIVTVSHCTDLGREYMEGPETWANGKSSRTLSGSDCILGSAANRTGHDINKTKVSTSFLENEGIDILAGHVPLGCNEFWRDRSGNVVDVQYVVFLRHPLHTFVSSLLFANRGVKNSVSSASYSYVDAGFARVNETIWNMNSKGLYHERYSKLLITPEQKAWVQQERVIWTHERRVNLTLSNIVKHKIVVGIVERLPESLVMLQYLLDGGQEASGLFEYFSSNKTVGLIGDYMQTQNETLAVVERLRRHPQLMGMLEDVLKFEQQIYDWGLMVHERQYRRIAGKFIQASSRVS